MKKTLILAVAVVSFALAGCAGTVVKDPTTGAVTVDLTQGKVEKATHAGFQAAAKYATDHGYPERAAVRLAQDAMLTAAEVQASACANAIAAAAPVVPDVGPVDPILAVEILEEAAGNFAGIPAKVKILCAPIPMPVLPVPQKF